MGCASVNRTDATVPSFVQGSTFNVCIVGYAAADFEAGDLSGSSVMGVPGGGRGGGDTSRGGLMGGLLLSANSEGV